VYPTRQAFQARIPGGSEGMVEIQLRPPRLPTENNARCGRRSWAPGSLGDNKFSCCARRRKIFHQSAHRELLAPAGMPANQLS